MAETIQQELDRKRWEGIHRRLRSQKPHQRVMTLELSLATIQVFNEHYRANGSPKE